MKSEVSDWNGSLAFHIVFLAHKVTVNQQNSTTIDVEKYLGFPLCSLFLKID